MVKRVKNHQGPLSILTKALNDCESGRAEKPFSKRHESGQRTATRLLFRAAHFLSSGEPVALLKQFLASGFGKSRHGERHTCASDISGGNEIVALKRVAEAFEAAPNINAKKHFMGSRAYGASAKS